METTSEEYLEEDVFEVEKIVDAYSADDGILYYLVRWKGYSQNDDSWEPVENLLTCQALMDAFWKEQEIKLSNEKQRKAEKRKGEAQQNQSEDEGMEKKSKPDEKKMEPKVAQVQVGTSSTSKDGSEGQPSRMESTFKGERYNESSNAPSSDAGDFDADRDSRAKDILAKWGDKEYQSRCKSDGNSSTLISKQESQHSLSVEENPESSDAEVIFVKELKKQVTRNDTGQSGEAVDAAVPDTSVHRNNAAMEAVPRKDELLSPNKVLLSTESINQIIQQDIRDREEKEKDSLDKSMNKASGPLLAAGMIGQRLEDRHFPSEKNKVLNPFAKVKLCPKPNKIAKETLKRDRDGEFVCTNVRRSLLDDSRMGGDASDEQESCKEARNPERNSNQGESKLLTRIKTLGSSIRELKEKGLVAGKLRPVEAMTEDIASNLEKDIEQSGSQPVQYIPIDSRPPTSTGKEVSLAVKNRDDDGDGRKIAASQCSSGKERKIEESNRAVIPPTLTESRQPKAEIKGTMFQKITVNLNRIKGIIKSSKREKEAEAEEKGSGVRSNDSVKSPTTTGERGLEIASKDMQVESDGKKDEKSSEDADVRDAESRTDDVGMHMKERSSFDGEKALENVLSKKGTERAFQKMEDAVKSGSDKSVSLKGKESDFGTAREISGNIKRKEVEGARIVVSDIEEGQKGSEIVENDLKKESGRSDEFHREAGRSSSNDDGRRSEGIICSDGRNSLPVNQSSGKRANVKSVEKKVVARESKADKKIEVKGKYKNLSEADLNTPELFEFTKIKDVAASGDAAKTGTGSKAEKDKNADVKRRVDTSKKARYAFQKQPSKESFAPARDDILGGILGRSEMMKSIDERCCRKKEREGASHSDKGNEVEKKSPRKDSNDMILDFDDYNVDENGLFPNDAPVGIGRGDYLDSIDVSAIKPIKISQDEFSQSIQAGRWEDVLGALAGGMTPDYWDNVTGGTLLWRAVEENNDVVAKKLIKFGANVNYKAENGKTVLMFSVEEGKRGFVEVLLKAGAHINVQQHNEETALILACRRADEDTINLLLRYGADAKLTPKSNPKDVYEYAPEYAVPSIRRIFDIHHKKLMSVTDKIIKQCLQGVKPAIQPPLMFRCISPGEKSVNEFYFNCKQNCGDKGVVVLLLCASIRFTPSGDITMHLERNFDNGVEAVILNKEHQIPVVKGSHILYFLFPKIGQLNSLTIGTHKCGNKLLTAVFPIQMNDTWIDKKMDSFYKEFGILNNLMRT